MKLPLRDIYIHIATYIDDSVPTTWNVFADVGSTQRRCCQEVVHRSTVVGIHSGDVFAWIALVLLYETRGESFKEPRELEFVHSPQ